MYTVEHGSCMLVFMQTYQNNSEQVGQIQEVLGYSFQDQTLLLQAFVHRSYFNEHRDVVAGSNERLEFLGDSVLGLIVSEMLFRMFPDKLEGELSHMRSYLVDASACAYLVQQEGLDRWILLGKGEAANRGRGRETIMADLFEALLGAVYLDGGWETVCSVFRERFEETMKGLIERPMHNWKGEMQDFAQKEFRVTPSYEVLEEIGPDHCKQFRVGVFIQGRLLGEGVGLSKKEAEIEAAKEAMKRCHG